MKCMKVIEGILIDRMDYKPQRIDDKLLAQLAERLRKGEKKKEIIDSVECSIK